MKLKFVLSAGLFFLFATFLSAQSHFLWAKQLGNLPPGPFYTTTAKAVTVDDSGNVITVGDFTDTIDFDPGPGVYELGSKGQMDIYITKFDADGNFIWAKSVGGIGDDYVSSVAADASGNMCITGSFHNTADFDPSVAVYNLSAVNSAIFILKLDSSGNFLWAAGMDGPYYDGGNSVAFDATGNSYFTGKFAGTVDFDPGPGIFNLSSPAYDEAFICKLDPAGALVWAKSFAGESNAESISLDPYGNIYTTGYYLGTVDFDPGSGVFNMSSAGPYRDAFVSKWDASGAFVWAKTFGGTTDYEVGHDITADSAGNVFITGDFRNTDFDPGPGVYTLTAGGSVDNAFICKLSASGNLAWAKVISGYEGYGYSILLDRDGNVYTFGTFWGVTDFDPGPGVYTLTASGNEGFISKLDPGGNFVWGKHFRGVSYSAIIGESSALGSAIDSTGNLYIAGSFDSKVDFDPGADSYTLFAPVVGGATAGYDSFVVKLGNRDVWPGDANADNIVNNTDLLPLGLWFSGSGSPRPVTGNLWQPYSATEWGTDQFSGGPDIDNADCNGDGVIDSNDTLAINLNYSLTHSFVPPAVDDRMTAPDLYFSSITGTYGPGAWVDIDILAGTASAPVIDLYGLSFDIYYDASKVEPGTESISYPVSWFANPGSNAISIQKFDAPSSMLYGAETRTDHVSMNGYGKIATFRFQAATSITTTSNMFMAVGSYKANDANGNPLSFNPLYYSINISPSVNITEPDNSFDAQIFPNPCSGTFNVSFLAKEDPDSRIEITNVLGKTIYIENFLAVSGPGEKQIKLEGLPPGVYTLRLENAEQKVVKKIIVY